MINVSLVIMWCLCLLLLFMLMQRRCINVDVDLCECVFSCCHGCLVSNVLATLLHLVLD